MSAAAVVIDIEGLLKRRSSPAGFFEVLVPHLRVLAGEFIALTGASGSGKSTVLDMLGMILRPTQASRFDFFPTQADAACRPVSITGLWEGSEGALAGLRRRHLGYVLQSGGLLPFLTVAQNVALARTIAGGRVRKGEIEEGLAMLGLEGKGRTKPARLSGGERQRAALLRALFNRPTLILADEPTAAVDRTRALEIIGELRRRAQEQGTTVILVTHDASLIPQEHTRRLRMCEVAVTDRASPGVGYRLAAAGACA